MTSLDGVSTDIINTKSIALKIKVNDPIVTGLPNQYSARRRLTLSAFLRSTH